MSIIVNKINELDELFLERLFRKKNVIKVARVNVREYNLFKLNSKDVSMSKTKNYVGKENPKMNHVVNPATGSRFEVYFVTPKYRDTDMCYHVEDDDEISDDEIREEIKGLLNAIFGIGNAIFGDDEDESEDHCAGCPIHCDRDNAMEEKSTDKDKVPKEEPEDNNKDGFNEFMKSISRNEMEKAMYDYYLAKTGNKDKEPDKKPEEPLYWELSENTPRPLKWRHEITRELNEDIKYDFYIVTNVTGDGEYTPSVFRTRAEAIEWMLECTFKNFMSAYNGDINFDGKILRNDENAYKIISSYGMGKVVEFLRFVDANITYPCLSLSDSLNYSEIEYSDGSVNLMSIYSVEIPKDGDPIVRPTRS